MQWSTDCRIPQGGELQTEGGALEKEGVWCFRYEEQGDIEEALENFREILKTDPLSAEAKQGMERCRRLQVTLSCPQRHSPALCLIRQVH